MQAAATGVSFGLEKALQLIAPEKFAQLASDEAALRRYVQDTPNAKRGVKGITFLMGAVDVEIVPHPMIKQGHSFMLSEPTIMRVGATDITFGMPGSGQSMEVQVTDATALEIRSMSDQGIFSEKPAQNVLLTDIS
jgi:hypothetical protein